MVKLIYQQLPCPQPKRENKYFIIILIDFYNIVFIFQNTLAITPL